jgi:hypothetical protein
MSNARDKANIPALNFLSTGIDDNATSTAITIDSSQNVGIDNTIPGSFNSSANQLVVGSGSGQNGITIYSGTSNNGSIHFGDGTGASSYRGSINYYHNGDTLGFNVGASEEMRLTSTGLGIGTSSPISQTKLTISSDNTESFIFFERSGTGRNDVAIGNNGGKVSFRTGGDGWSNTSERMVIDSSGNVGLGTSSPLKPLEIQKDNAGNSETLLLLQNNSGTDGTEVEIRLAPTPYPRDIGNAEDGGVARWSSIRATRDGAGNGTRMSFLTNSGGATPSERMRIHSNGHVAIGTTANTADLELETSERATGTNLGSAGICLRNSGTVSDGDVLPITGRFVQSAEPRAGIGFITQTQDGIAGYGGAIGFYTLGSADGAQLTSSHEKARIDKSGNVLFGGTGTSLYNDTSGTQLCYRNNASLDIKREGTPLNLNRTSDTGTIIVFYYNGTAVGNVSVGTSSVAYNTSSDYRLKENVSYDFDATTRLKQLKPARFNFISDADTTVDGFLAHEVSSVVPEAISGEKDAVDENGNPDYQGIDQSKLVPLLVKTIQELEARITTLEANNP